MISDNYNLVKVGIEDLKELRNISIATYKDTFASENTIENMDAYIDYSFTERKLLTELNDPNSEFYFLKLNKTTVGYLKLNFKEAQTDLKSNDGMEVERIYISKEYQRKKLGQLLLDQAVEKAINLKLQYIWLGVWEKNIKARAFYEKNDFTLIGSHPFMMGDDQQTDLILKKNLS